MKHLRRVVGATLTSAVLAAVAVVGVAGPSGATTSAKLRPATSCYPIGSQNCGGTIKVSPNPVAPGKPFTVAVTGFEKSSSVHFVICNLKTTTVRSTASGTASVTTTVPAARPPGTCSVRVTGPGDNTSLTLSALEQIRIPSTTSLRTSTGTAYYGTEASETFTVTVGPKHNGSYPAGTATVYSAPGKVICHVTLRSGAGSCKLGAKALLPANYATYASYGGSTLFSSSVSTKHSVAVRVATSTSLRVSAASITYGKETSETLTVAVGPKYAGKDPAGTAVVYSKAGHVLCRIALKSGGGSCKLSASALPVGTYETYATYGGSPVFGSSKSRTEKVTVKAAPKKKKTKKHTVKKHKKN